MDVLRDEAEIQYQSKLIALLEPTPLPEEDPLTTTLNYCPLDTGRTCMTWLDFNSSEPIADLCTDNLFEYTTFPTQAYQWVPPFSGTDASPFFVNQSSKPTYFTKDINAFNGVRIRGGEQHLPDQRWQERYNDLVAFIQRFGNSCVPSQWPENPSLAQWVKRQRYHLKLRKEGLHSTMTDEREAALNQIGFMWNPHTAFWEERLEELRRFRDEHGHANVPTKYPSNPQLAIWAKCQRRQMKLYLTDGSSKSNMTADRIGKLTQLGFVFNPRCSKEERSCSSLPTFRKDLLKSMKNEQGTLPQRETFVSSGRSTSDVSF